MSVDYYTYARTMSNKSPHPMQPLIRDEGGVPRFKANAIVRYLLDNGPFGLQQLDAMVLFSQEDWEQFWQLIGYSLSGFCELSGVSDAARKRAENSTEQDKTLSVVCINGVDYDAPRPVVEEVEWLRNEFATALRVIGELELKNEAGGKRCAMMRTPDGTTQITSIDDLPLDHEQKCRVLEWFANKLWVLLEEGSGDQDYYGKTYDPLVIEEDVAHSYVFHLEHGVRHHKFDSLAHLEKMLVDEGIGRIKLMLEIVELEVRALEGCMEGKEK